MSIEMKKITVKSDLHGGRTATFFVPSYLETSTGALVWLEGEAFREESMRYFGKYRIKLARVRRHLCSKRRSETRRNCDCGVKVEEI